MSISRRFATAALSVAAAAGVVAGAAQPASAQVNKVELTISFTEIGAKALPLAECKVFSQDLGKYLPAGIPRDLAEGAVVREFKAGLNKSAGYKVTLTVDQEVRVKNIAKAIVNKAVECGYVNSQDTSGVLSSGFSS